jgi:hypothetical protein
MTANGPTSYYALGSTDAEHERLIWQAARVAPFTERLFREAGIGPGQRVLDIGSGASAALGSHEYYVELFDKKRNQITMMTPKS